jgi:transposase
MIDGILWALADGGRWRNLPTEFGPWQSVYDRFRRRHTGQCRPRKGLPRSRFGRRLGNRDQVVESTRPTTRPKWMEAAAWASLPATRLVREVRYLTRQHGCRTHEVALGTTLLDAGAYPATALAELYLSRR